MKLTARASRQYPAVRHDCLFLHRWLSPETGLAEDSARGECSDKSVGRLLTAFAESLLLLAGHQHRRMTFPEVLLVIRKLDLVVDRELVPKT